MQVGRFKYKEVIGIDMINEKALIVLEEIERELKSIKRSILGGKTVKLRGRIKVRVDDDEIESVKKRIFRVE